MRFLESIFDNVTNPRMAGANLGLLIVYAMGAAMLVFVFSGQARKQREAQQKLEREEGEDPVAEFEMHSTIAAVDD